MKKHFTARIWKEGDWFVAQCAEIDIASQGHTEAEALHNLREAMELFLSPQQLPPIRQLLRSRSKLARLKPIPFREVRGKLMAAGFAEQSQRGSHVKFVPSNPEGTRTAIVPYHSEVQVGTLRSIINQAGLTPEEFEAL